MAEDNELIIDLTNYKDRVGSRVPEGRYRVQVEDIESTKARSGNPMINLFLRIVGGEFDSNNLMDRLVLTENSMFRVVGFMQAIGQPTPKKRLKVNPRNWVGKMLDVDVEDGEPYNGRVKSEVRGYNKIPQGEQSGADLDDLEQSPNGEGLNEFAAETSSNPDPSPQAAGTEEDQAETTTEDIDLDDVKL